MHTISVGCFTLAVALLSALPRVGAAQDAPAGSVLERTPNLTGGWTGRPGILQFNFLHRFRLLDPPTRQVTNVPTFLLAYRPAFPVLIGFNYASSSFIVPNFPNEFELFARAGVLSGERGGPLDLTVQASYHQAAKSLDAEVTLGRQAGPLRLFGVARFLSNGFARDTARYVVGGGAALKLSRYVGFAGDITNLLERRPGEDMAWSAALQLAIPYSPHTLSLQITNATTGTLQGSSLGTDIVRAGFEFTIPITLKRGVRRATAQNGGPGPAPDGGTVIRADIRQMAFPARIQAAAGATIEWTNHDVVAHTVTADDGSWDSGLIAPGATWRRAFAQPGDYAYHCTPHPYMRGVVAIR